MKVCGKCRQTLNSEEFYPNKSKADKLSSFCRSCTKAYTSEYYQRNKEKRNAQTTASRERKQKIKYEYLINYLLDRCCVDCGEDDVIVLEFDHVRGDKIADVSYLAAQGSFSRMVAEIEKCDVRCSNCHQRRHAIENNTIFMRILNEMSANPNG